ncbi:trigger factor [Treponema lecithinolyticum]|uniref:trigger factor n=1 Tax=Treponema lecithinolyticum TaxID=53418 RepID=UPI0028EF8EAA|nr:trigger factor [Treponema lecithinolyticum]
MNTTKKIEVLENSAVKLTITVAQKDVEENYNQTLNKYAKSLQIPGFRKGKAPKSVLERKYGDALKADSVSETAEKALEQVFEDIDKNDKDNRPLPYAQPVMEKAPDADISKDLEFSVVYDVMPKVSVKHINGISIQEPQVKIGDAELNKELEEIRERNAMVVDKKDGEKAAKGDVVTVDYWEIGDDDAMVANTKREDFVFTVGSGQNIYGFDDDIIGMKKGDTKTIVKTWKKDDKDADLAGKTKIIGITLKALKLRNVPHLDDELAQDVNEKYKTLADMKADISKNLNKTLETKLREIKSNALLEQLIEKNPITLPASMVQAETQARWQMMARQFQIAPDQLEKMVGASGQKKEDMLKQWAGDSEKMLKGRLIVESLLKERNITVTPEDVEAEYAKIANGAGISLDEVKKHYADASKKEYLIDDMKEQKLYDQLFSEIKITKGEKTTFEDLFKK